MERRKLVGSAGAILVAVAAACGGSPGAVPLVPDGGGDIKPFDNFVGTYNFSGTLSATGQGCSGAESNSGTLTIVKGSSADLLLLSEGCSIPANITGANSFVVVQTTCTQSGAGGTYALTLNGNGTVSSRVMNATLNGPITISSGGRSFTCQFNWTLNGTKL